MADVLIHPPTDYPGVDLGLYVQLILVRTLAAQLPQGSDRTNALARVSEVEALLPRPTPTGATHAAP
jgi:hypothetical protein